MKTYVFLSRIVHLFGWFFFGEGVQSADSRKEMTCCRTCETPPSNVFASSTAPVWPSKVQVYDPALVLPTTSSSAPPPALALSPLNAVALLPRCGLSLVTLLHGARAKLTSSPLLATLLRTQSLVKMDVAGWSNELMHEVNRCNINILFSRLLADAL